MTIGGFGQMSKDVKPPELYVEPVSIQAVKDVWVNDAYETNPVPLGTESFGFITKVKCPAEAGGGGGGGGVAPPAFEQFTPTIGNIYFLYGAKGYKSRDESRRGNEYKEVDISDDKQTSVGQVGGVSSHYLGSNSDKIGGHPVTKFLDRFFPGFIEKGMMAKLPRKYYFFDTQTSQSNRYSLVTSFTKANDRGIKDRISIQLGGTRRKRSASKPTTRSKTSKRTSKPRARPISRTRTRSKSRSKSTA